MHRREGGSQMSAHDVDPDLVLEFCARKGCNYPGVLLFFDWLDPITAFSLEELGQLLNAMFEYARYGSIPVFEDRALLICWAHIQPRLDQDRYNWAWKIVSSYYANYCKDAKKAGEPLACFEVWFKREIDALSGPAADRPEPDGIRTQSGAAQRVPDDTQPTNTIPTPVTIPAATPAPACSEERDRAAEFAVLDMMPRRWPRRPTTLSLLHWKRCCVQSSSRFSPTSGSGTTGGLFRSWLHG